MARTINTLFFGTDKNLFQVLFILFTQAYFKCKNILSVMWLDKLKIFNYIFDICHFKGLLFNGLDFFFFFTQTEKPSLQVFH